MTTGIMAAMHDEIAELIKLISEQDESTVCRVGTRDFYLGKLEGQPCVIVLAGIGKVAAACTAMTLIQRFCVSEIVFTGLAGGLADHIRVGDVVVADKLIQHDMDARPLFPRYEIPLTGIAEFTVSEPLRKRMQDAARHFFEHDIQNHIDDAAMTQFGLSAPEVHIGMIASGDQFIGAVQTVARLREELPAACAVEMEGAAVAQVCHEYGVPCTVIRTISDRANDVAHIDFLPFLKQIASKYSSAIVRNYLSAAARQPW